MIGQLGENDSRAILAAGNLGRLGCIADGEPYVVPINYFYDGEKIYIHSLQGRKIESLRANPRACLQVDDIEDAYHWRSVIAYGSYEEILDEVNREKLLSELFKRLPHLTPVESKMAKGPRHAILFSIKIDRITGIFEKW